MIGSPAKGTPIAGEVGKIAFFDWSRSLWLTFLLSQILCSWMTVGALAEERVVISNVGHGQSLLTTRGSLAHTSITRM